MQNESSAWTRATWCDPRWLERGHSLKTWVPSAGSRQVELSNGRASVLPSESVVIVS